MYYVYILQSLKDGRKYIGQTHDLEKRVDQHNDGEVASTKHRRPFKLIYREVFTTREEAVKCEKYFKTHKGYNYLKKKGVY